jgi:rhomboid-related protein 1/2/3
MQFVYSSYVHIATNLLVQLVLGIPLEMVHGWWRLLIVYLAGVIAGSLGTSITDPSVYLAGASGGVYALLLAHLASVILVMTMFEFSILISFQFS